MSRRADARDPRLHARAARPVAVCIAATLALATAPAAQSPRAFEVISIKPSAPDASAPLGSPGLPMIRRPGGGRVLATNISLRSLVEAAYDVYGLRVVDGPDWQTSRRFDIEARAADPAVNDLDDMRPMIRALLADRFQLKVHTESRELPIYALVVAREDGRPAATVTPSALDCSDAAEEQRALTRRGAGSVAELLQAGRGLPCAIMPVPARAAGSMTMRANGRSMADLAGFLTPQVGRIVQDRTGLTGLFDWEITYARARALQAAPGAAGAPALPAPSDSPPLLTALEEQLGLKLESARAPVDVLVIDSAALPEPD